MWFIYKLTPDSPEKKLVSTAFYMDQIDDIILYADSYTNFCKRAARLGDMLYEVKYECGARIYKVYGNLWVLMNSEGHQLKLGSFEECEDHLFCHDAEGDVSRKSMHYKDQFENCTYTAEWKEEE